MPGYRTRPVYEQQMSIINPMATRNIRGRSASSLICLFVILGWSLSACLARQNEPEATINTPTETSIAPTSTIVWFPATATSTIFPTEEIIPTAEVFAAHGELAFTDDFSDKSKWLLGPFPDGNILINSNTISLAVANPQNQLASFREKTILGDFFLTLTVEPGLCSQDDSFGVLFNVVNNRNYYRLAFNCTGQYRLEQLRENRTRVIEDWQSSAQVPRGPQMPFHLGLWYGGGLIRVFVEDVFQTEWKIPPASGGVGVYARTYSAEALTVTFSELQVFSVSRSDYPPTPTPTPTATKKPYPTAPKP